MSTAKEYYIQYTTENGPELVEEKYNSWDEMLKSDDYDKLSSALYADLSDIRGLGWLIVRPGKLPMVGSFIAGMRDPSL